jgi:nicotinate-nucleotide pyrophosphorylase (carboxylating)
VAPYRRNPLRSGPRAPGIRALLRRALAEDRFRSDRTTRALFDSPVPAHGVITAQAKGILSGAAAAAELARLAGVRVVRARRDGSRIARGTKVLEVEGDARHILSAERTMLNLLMHLSGVASATEGAVRAVRRAGGRLEIRGTRKTLPGLRDLEKLAIRHGGGRPHRRDLSDAVLVKSNHLALVPITEAIDRLRARRGHRERIEVEVRSYAEAKAALAAGADELLLDNRTPTDARKIISALRRLPSARGVPIELSGGMTTETVHRFARSGADSASLGSLTHSARALPFHLTIVERRSRPRR